MITSEIEQEVLDYFEEHHHCPACKRQARVYTFTLNKNMVHILQKIYGAICLKGKNDIHLDHDTEHTEFEMPYSQRSNVSILRFHGLVAKVKENGKHKAGHWLITKRGAGFLRGEIAVPKKTKTLFNRVLERDDDVEMVTFKDVMGRTPDAPVVDFIDYEFANETQLTKFAGDQGMLLDVPRAEVDTRGGLA